MNLTKRSTEWLNRLPENMREAAYSAIEDFLKDAGISEKSIDVQRYNMDDQNINMFLFEEHGASVGQVFVDKDLTVTTNLDNYVDEAKRNQEVSDQMKDSLHAFKENVNDPDLNVEEAMEMMQDDPVDFSKLPTRQQMEALNEFIERCNNEPFVVSVDESKQLNVALNDTSEKSLYDFVGKNGLWSNSVGEYEDKISHHIKSAFKEMDALEYQPTEKELAALEGFLDTTQKIGFGIKAGNEVYELADTSKEAVYAFVQKEGLWAETEAELRQNIQDSMLASHENGLDKEEFKVRGEQKEKDFDFARETRKLEKEIGVKPKEKELDLIDISRTKAAPTRLEHTTSERKPEITKWQLRKAMKSQMRDLRAEIQDLYADIVDVTERAGEKGMTKATQKHVLETSRNIRDKTFQYNSLKESCPSITMCIKDTSKRVAEWGNDRLSSLAQKGMNAGRHALTKIRDVVTDANNKAIALGETAFTAVDENIEKINRSYLAATYSIDKNIAQTMDKMHSRLEQKYSKNQEVKAAISDGFKNIGRALAGKERTITETKEYNNRQKAMLTFLENGSNKMRENIKDTLENYRDSLDLSMHFYKNVNLLREDAGLDMSKSVERRFADAKKKSAQLEEIRKQRIAKERAGRSEKEAPKRDDGERTR